MGSSIKWLLALGVGVAAGWALRSLSDTPEGAGVKLLEIGIKTKNRFSSWAALERERLEDMLAEAQSNIAGEAATADAAAGPTSRGRNAKTARREGGQGKTGKNNVTSFNS